MFVKQTQVIGKLSSHVYVSYVVSVLYLCIHIMSV